MNSDVSNFDQMMVMLIEGRLPSPLHRLAAAAEMIANTREPWWRWTCYLAVAIDARRRGIVPQ